MVAPTASFADRFITPPEPVLSGRWPQLKFTRRDLPVLVRMGLVPEDATTELINGVIVQTDRSAEGEDILRVGRAHRFTVEQLSNLRKVIDNDARHVESQQPLACGDLHEPQPDFMVIRGTIEQIAEDGPCGIDTFCVIEVADSSYERDSVQKLHIYAAAGVRQYIIINLRNRTAEVYANPDLAASSYSLPQIVTAEQALTLRVGEAEVFTVPLANLLS